ncbi:MAG: c-type cytochrome [Chloracidobacterium sp.]|nr:c-type cytochrome [Chloracidobacterium sp.]
MKAAIILVFTFLLALTLLLPSSRYVPEMAVTAQVSPTPVAFDQAAALAKLREQIKGRENEPATAVFKNIQTMKNTPAGRLLSVMEMGFARSLGVTCTHCHVPEKWDSEDKPQKQIAREMSAMVSTINRDLLRNIKNLKSEAPIVNCTTCHRGEVKPALNLPPK